MNKEEIRYQRRIQVLRARWPFNKGKVKVSRLYNSEEKCFEMQSIEGAAKIQLHASGKLVELYYLTEVKVSDSDLENESSHAHYATMHQSFAVHQTQESFDFPVNFLLAAKAVWDTDHEAEIEYPQIDEKKDSCKRVTSLPRNGAFAAHPAFSVIVASSDGAPMSGHEEHCLTLAEILRVATLPSKMLYRRVVAEVSGEDTTLFVSCRPSKFLPEIVVQVDCEHSLLTGCDGFFTWYNDVGRPEHRFTRETIPPSSAIDAKHTLSFCRHIDYVLQAFKYAFQALNHNVSPSSSTQPNDLQLVEEVNNELGRFRAFRGGRIRVVFADRTILQVERDGECCSFFFNDGRVHQTTLASAPLRHRAYIYQALEFGDWAFSSHEERIKRHVKRHEAQTIVAQELQRISVRCGMNRDPKIFHSCSKDAAQKKTANHLTESKTADRLIESQVPTAKLSLAAVRKLQEATLQHIVTVDRALHAAASVAADK
ncbi:unnamed protein product [Peronospora belbahrii]|uniref:C5orf34-like C-terminal domain-containing protein n=1 Tax=Peronospora belbahrii TaxID=622444 RepID=A0ABN8D6T9_9STRA|nr:unnamed protein product [Peronospora belbahrii]